MLANILQRSAVLGLPILSKTHPSFPSSTEAAPGKADCKGKVGIAGKAGSGKGRRKRGERGWRETLRPEKRRRRGPHH